MKVAVVGGGIGGLAAAERLLAAGADVTVFEAEAAAGGKIQSGGQEGFLAEDGPSSLLGSAATLRGLAVRAGLEGDLVEVRPPRTRYVLRGSRLTRAPSLGLFSPRGWGRLLLEPLFAKPLEGDPSLEALLVAHLGREVGQLAARLMAAGSYAGDPRQLSGRSAFELLGGMLAKRRSLLLAALAARRRKGPPQAESWSVAAGLGSLPRALAAALGPRLRCTARVSSVARSAAGFELGWGEGAAPNVVGDPGSPAPAGGAGPFDALVVALPPPLAGALLADLSPALAAPLCEVPLAPLAVVHLGVREVDLGRPARGFGLLAGDDGVRLLGTLFPSSLFPGRAPPGHALLSSYVGGALHPELVVRSDEALVGLCREELSRALGLRGTPAFTRVARHPVGIPQLTVGHGERLARVGAELLRLPGLALAGAGYRGISAELAAESGVRAAERLLPERH
ncbi:MAG: protoporphyrinogen oxidase [Deltaproteobacteria bacterium]